MSHKYFMRHAEDLIINVQPPESEGYETEGQSNNYSQTLVLSIAACPHGADVDAASSSVTWDASRCSNRGRCDSAKRGCKPSAGEVRSKSFSANEMISRNSADFIVILALMHQ